MWVLEKARADVSKYSSCTRCLWNPLHQIEHFVVQERVTLPPTPESAQGDEIEESTCSFCSDMCTLGSGQCLFCGEKQYRILFIAHGRRLVVAKSNSKSDIYTNWTYIQNLQTLVSNLVESSELDQNQSSLQLPLSPRGKKERLLNRLPLSPRSKKEKEHMSQQLIPLKPSPSLNLKEIFAFVRSKITALIKNNEDLQIEQSALLNFNNFKKHFVSLDDSDSSPILCTCFIILFWIWNIN